MELKNIGHTAFKYAMLFAIGVLLYHWGAIAAYNTRGYFALGGEACALLLPILYPIFTGAVRELFVEFKNWDEEDD